MRRLAVTLAILGLLALLAGCGGSTKTSSEPTTALLTAVRVDGTKVTFEFKSVPQHVTASYVPRSRLAESGSGKPVPLKGTAYLMIHFTPAATAEATASTVTFSYTGPRRIEGPGPVLEVAKTSDFEADLGWAIGLDRRLPSHVSQHGSSVTVSFD
jgi:hypothetical protein